MCDCITVYSNSLKEIKVLFVSVADLISPHQGSCSFQKKKNTTIVLSYTIILARVFKSQACLLGSEVQLPTTAGFNSNL